MAEETSFTQSDRAMLEEIHRILTSLEPHMPLLERAAKLLDNPAMKWRRKNHAVPQDGPDLPQPIRP